MTSRFVRISLACLLLLAMASPSFAARRSSLAGNLLIQDTDDVFIFPHLVAMHQRHVTFDVGPDDHLGSGGLIFGNEKFTLGAFAHRGDFFGAINQAFTTEGDIDNLRSEATLAFDDSTVAFNWVDVLGGFKIGEIPVGVRFSLGRNNFENNDADLAPVGASDLTAFDAVIGTREHGYDFSGEVSFFTGTTFGDSVDVNNVQTSFAFRRTALEESDALILGWLARATYGSGSADVVDFSNLGFTAGVGPVYKPNDRTNVAMYGTVEYERAKVGVGSAEVTASELVGPGWHVAAEAEVASWMQFLVGLRSRYDFLKIEGGTSEIQLNIIAKRVLGLPD